MTRLKVVLALTFVGLCVASPALANTFPDLPGMRGAEKATRGRSAQVENAPAGAAQSTGGSSTPSTQSVINKAATADQVKSIKTMPGGSSLPIINEVGLTSHRSESHGMPRGLTALAAFGTLFSVGGYAMFRRVLAP